MLAQMHKHSVLCVFYCLCIALLGNSYYVSATTSGDAHLRIAGLTDKAIGATPNSSTTSSDPDIIEETSKDEGDSSQTLASYKCPPNSYSQVELPLSFLDCQCETGYVRLAFSEEGEVVGSCAFQCPERSHSSATTPSQLSDCTCDEGYVMSVTNVRCELVCPKHSNPIARLAHIQKNNTSITLPSNPQETRDVKSIENYCRCTEGFAFNQALQACEFMCPKGRISRDVQSIPESVEDCICAEGLKANLITGSCDEVYKCPAHSSAKDLSVAPSSFADCVCDFGFIYVQSSESCRPQTAAPYPCPPFSIETVSTPQTVHDCICQTGYEMGNSTCVKVTDVYHCPAHSFNSLDSKELHESSFKDCECSRGYARNQTSESCIQSDSIYTCPPASVMRQYPPFSLNDCQCLFSASANGCDRPERFAQETVCPPHSFAHTWPVVEPLKDCMCAWGYGGQQENSGRLYCTTGVSADQERQLQAVPTGLSGEGFADNNVDDISQFQTSAMANGDYPEWQSDDDVLQVNSSLTQAIYRCPPYSVNQVDAPQSIADCKCLGGRRVCRIDGTCTFPVEDVRVHTKGLVTINKKEISYALLAGNVMVIEGDIALGEYFGQNEDNAPVFAFRGAYKKESDYLWPQGRMCYAIDGSIRSRSQDIHSAMHHIRTHTGFQFQSCGEHCPTTADCTDYVKIYYERQGSYSFIGRIGGLQKLGLDAATPRGSIIHLLLHAIGMRHEHNRQDRNLYLTLGWECIEEPSRDKFIDLHDSGMQLPYDYSSIMHGPHGAFAEYSKSWCSSVFPTIADKDERVAILRELGQRLTMSAGDAAKVRLLYSGQRTPKKKTEDWMILESRRKEYQPEYEDAQRDNTTTSQRLDKSAKFVQSMSNRSPLLPLHGNIGLGEQPVAGTVVVIFALLIFIGLFAYVADQHQAAVSGRIDGLDRLPLLSRI